MKVLHRVLLFVGFVILPFSRWNVGIGDLGCTLISLAALILLLNTHNLEEWGYLKETPFEPRSFSLSSHILASLSRPLQYLLSGGIVVWLSFVWVREFIEMIVVWDFLKIEVVKPRQYGIIEIHVHKIVGLVTLALLIVSLAVHLFLQMTHSGEDE